MPVYKAISGPGGRLLPVAFLLTLLKQNVGLYNFFVFREICDPGAFAKTLADCRINRIAAAVSPAFCYNFSHVALCQSLFRNGGSPVARVNLRVHMRGENIDDQ